MYLTIQEQFANLFEDIFFEQLLEVGETCESIGYNLIGTSVTEIIQLDYSPEAMRSDIKAVFNEALLSVLSQYAIKINDNYADSTFKLHDLVKLLIKIENNENHDDILAIIESDEDPIEVLINLSDYLGELDWTLICELVEETHPILIHRIKEHHQKASQQPESDDTPEDDRLTTFFKTDLAKKLGENPIIQLNKESYGFEIESMLNLLHDKLIGLSEDHLAANLLLLALASDLPSDKINAFLEMWLNRHLDDPRKIIGVSGKITRGNVGHV